jgi:hypothetical protein
MLVPEKFVIPDGPDGNDAWPKEAWGIKLATIVNSIRRGLPYVSRREDLIGIGFSSEKERAHYGFDLVRLSLSKYQEIYRAMLVPSKFETFEGQTYHHFFPDISIMLI